jgi:glyoxylase-like metal-dependent hydrolase (beta-lactamase superfamily II)
MAVRRREPAPGVFRLVLPLPFPGLRHVNAYLLSGDERDTLVDCGIHDLSPERDHGWDDLIEALDTAGSSLERLERLVITHPHIDHYGMAARIFETTGCELWMHEEANKELDAYRSPEEGTERVKEMLADHGVSKEDIDELAAYEDWRGFITGIVEPTHPLKGGEKFDVGDRTWEMVHTPGHSPSHICVWTGGDRILVSGDHLLPTITPHIDFRRGESPDPLGEFLESLKTIERLEPALVLPGHGRPFEDGGERARAVARHHDRRLGSILQVIRHEPHTASEITDEVFGTSLLNFERRLALGEALAHLAYLVRRGEIERVEAEDGTFRYRKVSRRRETDDE